MYSAAEFFKNNRPQPKFLIGDRVFGRWNKIPFVGTVLNDRMVNEEQGPVVSINLDLPIKHQDKIVQILHIKQSEVKKLVSQ